MAAATELREPLAAESAVASAPHTDLDVTLRATIDALTELDAGRLEALALACEQMAGGVTAIEAGNALDAHRVLRCLLAHTRQNLELLTRITERSTDQYPGSLHPVI